jgi:hypothetical protein
MPLGYQLMAAKDGADDDPSPSSLPQPTQGQLGQRVEYKGSGSFLRSDPLVQKLGFPAHGERHRRPVTGLASAWHLADWAKYGPANPWGAHM